MVKGYILGIEEVLYKYKHKYASAGRRGNPKMTVPALRGRKQSFQPEACPRGIIFNKSTFFIKKVVDFLLKICYFS